MIRRTGLSLAIRLSGIGLSFAALLVLARALEPAELGRWAWAVELVALACVVAGLGFNIVALRVVPDCLVARDAAGLRRFVGAGIFAAVTGSALAGAALGLVLGWGKLALLAMALLPVFAIMRFLQEVARGSGRIMLAQAGEQVVWPGALLATAALLWQARPASGAAELLLGVQIASFAAIGAALVLVASRMADAILLPAKIRPADTRGWLAGGMPLALCAALSVFLNRGDIIALGLIATPSEVAFYTPVSRLAALLVLGQAAASMATAARMRSLWRAGDWGGLQHALDHVAILSVVFAAPLALAFWLFPGPLLALFGPEYRAGAGALQVLAAAQLVNCWTGPVAAMVVAAELERVFAAMTGAAAVVMAVLLALLVEPFGIVGAALATLAGIAVLNLGMAWIVRQRTGLVCWARPVGFASLLRRAEAAR